MSKTLLLLSFITALLSANDLLYREQVMMGTFVTLGVTQDKEYLLQEGFNRLKEIDTALSSYKKSAVIYQLNHNKRTNIPRLTKEALLLSLEYYKKTNGYFDITVGSLTKGVYHFGEDKSSEINASTLDAQNVNLNGLHVRENEVVLDANITLDLGGMGKGFGVDKVYALFKKANVTKGIIKLSGDIKCISTCQVDISNPFEQGEVFATFRTKKNVTAISTSGNYRRYIKNKTYNHLINPKTKRSEQNFASLTLISEGSNAEIDAIATAVMVMPKKEAFKFLKENKYVYVLVDNNKNIYLSNTLDYLTEFKLLKALK